ncbi:MAG: hypothetical protein VX519_10585 [Myxococcota bacterium]|nr:hypothetical protein [Myxococcota bacterium]
MLTHAVDSWWATAWACGRRSRSLYEREVDDALLAMTVGDLRGQIRMPDFSWVSNRMDWLTYWTWTVQGLVLELVGLLVAIGLGIWKVLAG